MKERNSLLLSCEDRYVVPTLRQKTDLLRIAFKRGPIQLKPLLSRDFQFLGVLQRNSAPYLLMDRFESLHSGVQLEEKCQEVNE